MTQLCIDFHDLHQITYPLIPLSMNLLKVPLSTPDKGL